MIREQVRQQAVKGARVSKALNGTVWKNKYLNVEINTKIYKSAARLTIIGKGRNGKLAKNSWDDTNGPSTKPRYTKT